MNPIKLKHSRDLNPYSGLVTLLENAQAVANPHQLSAEDAEYLGGCVEGTVWSLGLILEVFGKLVEVNSQAGVINGVDEQEVALATQELNATVGAIMPTLFNIAQEMHAARNHAR